MYVIKFLFKTEDLATNGETTCVVRRVSSFNLLMQILPKVETCKLRSGYL